MSAITITDLITRVRTQIRDNGAVKVFTDEELTQYIDDAVMDYSKYRPLKKSITFELIKGQTIYDLPYDWMKVDTESFEEAIMPNAIPDYTAYALPFIYVSHPLGTQLSTMKFRWNDDEQELTLSSAPIQTYVIAFQYYAYHTADSTKVTVPKHYQHKALLPAYEKALRAIATDYAVKLQKYKIGGRDGVEIDDSKIAENLLIQAEEYRKQYDKEIVLKPYGSAGGA